MRRRSMAKGGRAQYLSKRSSAARSSASMSTPDSGKAVGKDAAFEVLAESLADIRLGGVVVALPVALPGTGQLMPSLEVFCYGLVEQSPLGVTRVVEFGLCHPLLPARV